MSSSLRASSFGKRALVHLKKLKPHDGWSLEIQHTSGKVRLLRRSVPLTDHFFQDVHYDSGSGNVVGIITKSPPCQAQVLVNPKGKPVSTRSPTIVYVTTWKETTSSTTTTTTSATRSMPRIPTSASAAGAAAASTIRNTAASMESLSDEQNQQLMMYAAYAVAIAVAVKLVLSAMMSLYIILFPLAFLYALQTCPTEGSFDAKKELKRVMRGHHLPEDHPDKPRGWLNETIAKVSASVTAELATGLGYELSMTNLANACLIANVNVPSVNRGYIWLGIFGKWRFIYSAELEATEGGAPITTSTS